MTRSPATRVVFELGGDRRLCFVDQRKLGFVAVVGDIEKHCQSEGLGPTRWT